MQETPNYESYKSRFNSFLLPNLIDHPGQEVQGVERRIIEDTYNRIAAYFTEDEYRRTLPINRRNNVEGQIGACLDQFQQILTYLASSPAQLLANIQNITNNLQSYLEEIDLRFWNPYQIYVLQHGENIADEIAKIKTAAREAEVARNQAESNLKAQGTLIAQEGEVNVADYYQRTINGHTIARNDELISEEKPLRIAPILKIMGITSVVLVFAGDEIGHIIKAFDRTNVAHYVYVFALLLFLSAYPIALFAKWLNRTKPSGYERAATLWVMGSAFSVVITGVYASILLAGFNGDSGWDELVPKLVSLLAPAYFVRFCVQNYRANKHMAIMNSQKAVAARSVQAYTANLRVADEALRVSAYTTMGEIQKNVAMLIFEPGETGYLTVKEGAGSSDSYFQGVLTDKLPK